MSELIKIIGVGLVTCVCALLLKNTRPELSLAVTVAGVVIMLIFSLDILSASFGFFAEIGEKTGKSYLAERYVCTYEAREHRIMPQFVQIEGCGEIALTRIFELDRMAEVLRKMRSGENGADILDELTDDCSPCAVGRGELQYDEDVILAGQKEAKLGVVESDAFRKAICKRLRDKAEKYKPLFSENRWNELWNAGINLRIKAHCVCETRLYAMMAYFKIRYPGQWIR